MTQMDEIKSELSELRSSIDGLRRENARLREEMAIFKAQADDAVADQSDSDPPVRRSLFWAFLRGMGSVLEIYPPEGCFDRWRRKEAIPENDFALLFRELWDTTHPEKPSDGVEA
jgi:hypothetical protein